MSEATPGIDDELKIIPTRLPRWRACKRSAFDRREVVLRRTLNHGTGSVTVRKHSLHEALPSVFFFDPYPYLCDGSHCPLGEGNKAFYYDPHHLTPYGAMWLQRPAFREVSRFLRDSAL